MFRLKRIIFPLLLCCLAIASCEKEQSTENGGQFGTGGTSSGTAVYTLDGAPDACITPIINGTYIDNVPLDASNSVIVSVNVTAPGTYTISTGLINGIRFSASGTFSTTGAQAITLLGSGTPNNATINTFVPGSNGCSFIITTVVGSASFLKCKIDGVQYNFDYALSIDLAAPDTFKIGGLVSSTFETLEMDLIGTITPAAGVYEEEGVNVGSPAFVEAGFLDETFTTYGVDIDFPDPSVPRPHRFKVTITGITSTRATGTFEGGMFEGLGGTNVEKVFTEGSFDLPIQ